MHQDKDQSAWHVLAQTGADALILSGDNVYGDTNGGHDLTPLRAAYDTLEASREFRQLSESVEILPTWDDHDYGDNDAGGDFPGRN